MKIIRSYRYRIYPSSDQSLKMTRWNDALRFLWNICLEQWHIGMDRPRNERVYPSCELNLLTPNLRTSPVVAIDRGITNVTADSDGNLTPNPRHFEMAMKRLSRARRILSRRKKGSKNREKAKLRVMRLHRKVRRQREHFLHVLSHNYAKSHGVIVIENLNVAGMKRARPLARSIANVGWSAFAEMLRYKLAWSGGTLIEVPAQYSSQTCSACGAVDAASRKGEHFCCTSCGHVDHADINAAKVLKTRASRSGLPVEGSVLEAAR